MLPPVRPCLHTVVMPTGGCCFGVFRWFSSNTSWSHERAVCFIMLCLYHQPPGLSMSWFAESNIRSLSLSSPAASFFLMLILSSDLQAEFTSSCYSLVSATISLKANVSCFLLPAACQVRLSSPFLQLSTTKVSTRASVQSPPHTALDELVRGYPCPRL